MPAVGRRSSALALLLLTALTHCARPSSIPSAAADPSARWWKGTTHVHTLWSDGDHFPEMVAAWYRDHGYHFVAITDHNTIAAEERWLPIPRQGTTRTAYDRYRARFAPSWVEERRTGDTLFVRLRRLDEYRTLLGESGRFLVISGEEITQYLAGKGAHMNALNVVEAIPPQPGATLVEMLRADLDRLRDQEVRTSRNIVGVLNHPNFLWSQTAEDLLALPDLRFFEVYNGHPLVNTLGDSIHPSTERLWDIVLTRRLSTDGTGATLLYGVATDDAHDYHEVAQRHRNPGRGWIVVRSPSLEPDALLSAMERGDFYASTGVELTALRADPQHLSIAVREIPGITYRIQFIGTRRGYDTSSVVVRDSNGAPVTRRYSPTVGAVLAEHAGGSATYAMRGGELYVRARVISSRRKSNGSYQGEHEMAWTQPVAGPTMR